MATIVIGIATLLVRHIPVQAVHPVSLWRVDAKLSQCRQQVHPFD
jgi:hypothetical protein